MAAYYYFGQAEPPNAETNGPDQLYYIPEFAAVAERYLKLKASSSTPVLEEYVKERKEYVTEAIKASLIVIFDRPINIIVRTSALLCNKAVGKENKG